MSRISMKSLDEIDRKVMKHFKEVDRKVQKLVLGEIREEKRVPIPSDTRKSVYERANGRCESCGMLMKMTDRGAQFHHIRKPTVKSRPSTIQFLCARCHTKHGHEFYTVTKSDPLGTIKETKIKRKKVRKHKSPYWKEKAKTSKKKPTKRKTRKVTKT